MLYRRLKLHAIARPFDPIPIPLVLVPVLWPHISPLDPRPSPVTPYQSLLPHANPSDPIPIHLKSYQSFWHRTFWPFDPTLWPFDPTAIPLTSYQSLWPHTNPFDPIYTIDPIVHFIILRFYSPNLISYHQVIKPWLLAFQLHHQPKLLFLLIAFLKFFLTG